MSQCFVPFSHSSALRGDFAFLQGLQDGHGGLVKSHSVIPCHSDIIDIMLVLGCPRFVLDPVLDDCQCSVHCCKVGFSKQCKVTSKIALLNLQM